MSPGTSWNLTKPAPVWGQNVRNGITRVALSRYRQVWPDSHPHWGALCSVGVLSSLRFCVQVGSALRKLMIAPIWYDLVNIKHYLIFKKPNFSYRHESIHKPHFFFHRVLKIDFLLLLVSRKLNTTFSSFSILYVMSFPQINIKVYLKMTLSVWINEYIPYFCNHKKSHLYYSGPGISFF